jgi:hypothetical protein
LTEDRLLVALSGMMDGLLVALSGLEDWLLVAESGLMDWLLVAESGLRELDLENEIPTLSSQSWRDLLSLVLW